MNIIEMIKKEITKSDKSRYQISKETGINETQLHRVMMKNQDLYSETASKLLTYFGYVIVKKPKKKEAKKTGKK